MNGMARVAGALMMAGTAWAGGLTVTAVTVGPVPADFQKGEDPVVALATVTINGVLDIAEIRVLESGGKKSIKYPEFVRKPSTGTAQMGGPRSFPNVKVIDESLNKAIETAVLSGKPAGPLSPTGESPAQHGLAYEVAKFSKPPVNRPGSRFKGSVDVTFNKALVVIMPLMQDEKGTNVVTRWPARRVNMEDKNSSRISIVNLRDAVLRADIEKKVLDLYSTQEE